MKYHLSSSTLSVFAGMLLLVALQFSCEKVGTDGFYQAHPIVYFPSDSVQRFSFGTRFDDEYQLKIPVKLTGVLPQKSTRVNVRVVEDKTSAKIDENYRTIPSSFEIPAGSYDGELSLDLLRGNLSSTVLESVDLVLELEDSQDVKADLKQNKRIHLRIDNYLQEPYYWQYYESFFGAYSPIKFRKFLEYYDNDVQVFENKFASDFWYTMLQFKKVYDFFKAHPEYGDVHLPETLTLPYQPKNNN